MMRQSCALLPLSGRTDEDALDVWEHVACASWLESCPLPGDERREAAAQRAFDAECDHWDSLVFRGVYEENHLLDAHAFDEDYAAMEDSDSAEDY